MASLSKFYLNFILVVSLSEKILSGDYIGYFAKLGEFILGRYYRGMFKIIDSYSVPADQSKSFSGINTELL